jgi:hypothetical protein
VVLLMATRKKKSKCDVKTAKMTRVGQLFRKGI